MQDNTYTVIDYETLEPYFPEESQCEEQVLLPRPARLIKRSELEVETLKEHPFFKLGK